MKNKHDFTPQRSRYKGVLSFNFRDGQSNLIMKALDLKEMDWEQFPPVSVAWAFSRAPRRWKVCTRFTHPELSSNVLVSSTEWAAFQRLETSPSILKRTHTLSSHISRGFTIGREGGRHLAELARNTWLLSRLVFFSVRVCFLVLKTLLSYLSLIEDLAHSFTVT